MSDETTAPRKPGGRPALTPEERLDAVLSFRLHTAEKAHIQEQADIAGLTPGEYVRRRILGHRVNPRPAKADAALLHELSRLSVKLINIGNLVNQLARATHIGKRFTVEWGRTKEQLNETTAQLQELFRKVGTHFD